MPRYNQACTSCDWVSEIEAAPFVNPPCPQCSGATERSWHGQPTAIERDEIPGGQIFENGFTTPQIFHSHSAHRAALAERGCEIRAKWVPGDKHLTRWDSVDLEGAAALVSRGKTKPVVSETEEFPITVTTLDETFRYRMEP